MAGSAGSIFVDLLLNDTKYVQGLERSRRTTKQTTDSWTRDLQSARESFSSVLLPINNISTAAATLAGVLSSAISVQKIAQYSDAWKQLEGRLNLVTDSSSELATTQQRLFDIAQETRSDLGSTVTLYQRLSSSVKGLGISQEEVFQFTEQLNKMLITSGLSASEASASVYQLTQGFNKGKLDGDEFKTLLESAPPVLEALEKSLNKSREAILKMSSDGLLGPKLLVKAILDMSEVTDDRFNKFNLTISQAFQQLDNAFLQYIGQSKAVNGATSSVALALNSIAKNIDIVVDAVVVLSTVMVTKLVAAFISANIQAFAYQIALARMAGISATTATAILGLSAAGRTLSVVLASLGGPLGIAFIAAVTAFTFHTNEAVESQEKYNKVLGEISSLTDLYKKTSGEAAKQIKIQIEERMHGLQEERKEVEKLIAAYGSLPENNILSFFLEFGGKLGIGHAPSEVAERYQAIIETIEEGNRRISKQDGPLTALGGGDDKNAKKITDLFRGLNDEYEELILQVDLYNQGNEDAIATELKLLKIRNDLAAAGITLSEVDEKRLADTVARNEAEQEKLDEIKQHYKDLEEFQKRAVERIQDAFADFLYDPFQDGIQGMLKGFVDVLRKMAAEAAAAKLGSLLMGGSDKDSDGGIFGGLFKSLAGSIDGSTTNLGSFSLPKFADGGFLQPGAFGIAGEEGPELLYGGNTGVSITPRGNGGNVYNIDARGADQGAVRRLEQSLLTLAGPGVIEQRVNNGQRRGEI